MDIIFKFECNLNNDFINEIALLLLENEFQLKNKLLLIESDIKNRQGKYQIEKSIINDNNIPKYIFTKKNNSNVILNVNKFFIELFISNKDIKDIDKNDYNIIIKLMNYIKKTQLEEFGFTNISKTSIEFMEFKLIQNPKEMKEIAVKENLHNENSIYNHKDYLKVQNHFDMKTDYYSLFQFKELLNNNNKDGEKFFSLFKSITIYVEVYIPFNEYIFNDEVFDKLTNVLKEKRGV